MKKYLIKRHYEATETNENFKGEVTDYYCGKGGSSFPGKVTDGYVQSVGYSRLCDARRVLKEYQELDKTETSRGHWVVESSIVEF